MDRRHVRWAISGGLHATRETLGADQLHAERQRCVRWVFLAVLWFWQLLCNINLCDALSGIREVPTVRLHMELKAPMKCKKIVWHAAQHRIWTLHRMERHGLQDQSHHILSVLIQCGYAREVWYNCLLKAGRQSLQPNMDDQLEAWWLRARACFHHKERRGFDAFVILTVWTLWKQRNSHVFNNIRVQCTAMELANRIWDEMKHWNIAGFGGWQISERVA